MIEFWRFHSVNSTLYMPIEGHLNIGLVGLSVAISIIAAYSYLIIIDRIWQSNQPSTITVWKILGSVVFGLGVWAMHFTAMLAYMLPVAMSYNIALTLISLFPPMIGAYVVFDVLHKQRFSFIDCQICALSLAVGIGSMHYLGMEAMTVDATMTYSLPMFALSIMVAYLFASVAILLIKRHHKANTKSILHRIVTSVVMGFSVAGMHYTAMEAVRFHVENDWVSTGMNMGNSSTVALVVTFFVIMVFAATLISSIVDSQLQNANVSLEASMGREKDILDSLTDGLLIVDEEGKIDSTNAMVAQMFGFEDGCMTGQSLSRIIPNLDAETVKNTSENDIEHRTSITMEGQKASGRSFPIEVSISAISSRQDEKRLFCCVVRDITARMELEQQLRQSQKLESIGQLSAGIAHEINTPTQYVSDNAIFLKDAFTNYATILEQIKQLSSSEESDIFNKKLNSILEENDIHFIAQEVPLALNQSLEGLQRISKIVRAMKSFSHSSNHEKQKVDIAEAIESTITIARGEWRYVATVETSFDTMLPPIPCFRDEFNQVVLNFVINAAHAIEERYKGEEQGVISISTQLEQQYALIKIKDNGTGMPQRIVDRIFDPFFTTKDVGKGTGQGLSLAYSVIVELHGGSIHTESTVGQGTEFFIRLPLELAQPVDQKESVHENSIG
ncbi:MHYT domain-containing protein [Vibrio mexicanus]|uniref:MHYT domain-containing protein n=1 Tax=Vibrio mexicanus TaxID=1004326 RepID=UPI00063CBA2D|nr:MHYT domain-containing protein [Vibrio mexicanus]